MITVGLFNIASQMYPCRKLCGHSRCWVTAWKTPLGWSVQFSDAEPHDALAVCRSREVQPFTLNRQSQPRQQLLALGKQCDTIKT